MKETTRRYMLFGTHSERLSFDINLLEEGRRWVETDTGYEYVKYDGAWHTPPTGGGGPHTHPESEVVNLPADLDGKAPSSHTHTESQITNLVTDLAGKAALSHTHTQAESHNSADTDLATTSLHHTIGSSATQAAAGNHTHAGGSGLGMAINVQALTSSPVDGQTVYFGMLPKAPVTVAATSKIYVRSSCTIKRAEIYVYSGTAGTAEAWSLYIRKNNSTDTLIATLGVSTNERVFSNTALNISLVAGDYFEIKGVQPTWATNPATTIYGGYVYLD